MKKSELQRIIKTELLSAGFVRVKSDDYAITAQDGTTKIIFHIPDGKKGFIIGAQFADFGLYDGLLAHATIRQYDFAYELAFGAMKDFSDEAILTSVHKVLGAYRVYIVGGTSAIKERIDEWTFGDLDEDVRANILCYLGITGVDPYSEAYQKDQAEKLKHGGSLILTMQEYLEHKAFYNNYEKYNAQISVNEKKNEVIIQFVSRQWYQQ